MLHKEMNIIINRSEHVVWETEHGTYQLQNIKNTFAHGINELKHMRCKIAHIVDGLFGHGANIFGAA